VDEDIGRKPSHGLRRQRSVNRLIAAAVAGLLVLAACEVLSGPDRLVAELQSTGMPAALGTDLDASLFGGEATNICVADESVNVYEYPDVDAAIQAAAMVDRDDPSMVGNGIVEWAGTPHFWQRDRLLVLYVGEDAAVEAALSQILGPPFAEGTDPGRGVPGRRPPCKRAG
jgi:hypothetical protein